MVSDALAGNIDTIVIKSISRFARNTIDSLTTVRKLKEKGVEVYFEKENIYTLDSKGEPKIWHTNSKYHLSDGAGVPGAVYRTVSEL